jgi:hypothetical protein
MWKETIVIEFEISLEGLWKTTIKLKISGLRARTGIQDLPDTNPNSLPRPAVPRLCKAETEVPWAETQSEHGGYAPRTFILGTRWKVAFTLWRTLPFGEECLFPG